MTALKWIVGMTDLVDGRAHLNFVLQPALPTGKDRLLLYLRVQYLLQFKNSLSKLVRNLVHFQNIEHKRNSLKIEINSVR